MSGKRAVSLLILSIGSGFVLWSDGSSGRLMQPLASRLPSVSFELAESSLNYKRTGVLSPSRSKLAPKKPNESRSLLRTGNENAEEEDEGDKMHPNMLPVPQLLNQRWYPNPWYSNPINEKVGEGISKGLSSVGIFFIVWFACMCTIGGIMRCYLCCGTMWTDSNYNLRSLYDSFVDREQEPGFDNELEGIALDSLTSRDIESSDD
mmetsp:Transcript_3832/g.8621  ORF Transcript_3832/g.8621 Transcript_3832/m.8621 type:complete len:206 (+) Transcript_3832:164-781(+)